MNNSRIEKILGLMSKSTVEMDRLQNLCNAICECKQKRLKGQLDSQFQVPSEWLQEMRSLIESILIGRVRW